MFLGILGWTACGAILGFIVSKMVDLRGDDPRLGVAIAALGGIVGGWLYSLISGSPVSGFNILSLLSAAVLAAAAAAIWHFIRTRGPHEKQTIRRSY